ncbi:MAG: hypothetical protein LBD01_05305 [Puniceicoccales bacterium]|jgi:hypothetical protein|nr:hypothetical protein [Puniceicoccales bacterium]
MHSHERPASSLLCGAHATHVALGLLGDSNRNLQEILNAFPAIKKTGVSLNEIALFFQEKGYYWAIQNLSEMDIIKGTPENVYIVLDTFDKHMSHLVVKKKNSPEQLQIIDFPEIIIKTERDEVFAKTESPCLVIAKQPLYFFPKNEFIFALSTLLSFFILFLLIRRIILQRKRT